ncbi:MAG: alpha/beta fold hydrolase [Bacillota bacterium]
MLEKNYSTSKGDIHYWVNNTADRKSPQLVFLPGLTADHTLFERQVEYFEGKYPVLVWDAPGHSSSYPFEMSFSLTHKAKWLDDIISREGFSDPVIAGQSMGGYVGQMYSELFPEKLRGFISIDSAPLKKEYMKKWELWALKRMEPVYRWYPWKMLLRHGSRGVSTTDYGRQVIYDTMKRYEGNQKRYAELAGHGFRILAKAIEADWPYDIKCPALLICGTEDHAGECKKLNRAWHKKSGIPIVWIEGAGHDSNTDEPELVNNLIERFLLEYEF